MVERLLILAAGGAAPAADGAGSAADDARSRLEALGGRQLARYGDAVWVVELPPDAEAALADDPSIQGVFDGPVPDNVTVDDEAARLGIAAWDMRHSRSFRAAHEARRGDGRAWDDEDFDPEG
jgi:hypothetical protein